MGDVGDEVAPGGLVLLDEARHAVEGDGIGVERGVLRELHAGGEIALGILRRDLADGLEIRIEPQRAEAEEQHEEQHRREQADHERPDQHRAVLLHVRGIAERGEVEHLDLPLRPLAVAADDAAELGRLGIVRVIAELHVFAGVQEGAHLRGEEAEAAAVGGIELLAVVAVDPDAVLVFLLRRADETLGVLAAEGEADIVDLGEVGGQGLTVLEHGTLDGVGVGGHGSRHHDDAGRQDGHDQQHGREPKIAPRQAHRLILAAHHSSSDSNL